MKLKRMKLIILALTVFLFACTPTDETEVSTEPTEDAQIEEVTGEEPEEDTDSEEEVDTTNDTENVAEERFAQFYMDVMESDNYTMVYKGYWDEDGVEQEVLFTMTYFDEKTAMQIEDASGSIVATTIMEQEEMHLVNHEEETVITLPLTQMEDTMENLQELEELDSDQLEFVGEGTDTFMGNSRSYEEYRAGDTNVFYYFDGDNLDGIEFISGDNSTIIDLESITSDIDETLFEIPEHYQQIGLNF